MNARTQAFELPPDYTFTPGGMLVHKDTLKRLEKLVKKGRARDPNMFNLYIYNDFFGYGIIELVDEALIAAHTFVVKKKWLDAWRVLDCLQKFNDMCDDWHNIDDGDRTIATERAYGALLITTVRGLDHSSPSLFNEANIPDLEQSLSDMAKWGDIDPESYNVCYSKVLKGYGRKLFGARTNNERKQAMIAQIKAYKAFVRGLNNEEREKRGDILDDEDEDEDEEKNGKESEDNDDEDAETLSCWFGNAKIKDVQFIDPSFRLTSIWKEYKTILAGSSHVPLYGPPVWDLTKWTDKDKRPFTFKGRESRSKRI